MKTSIPLEDLVLDLVASSAGVNRSAIDLRTSMLDLGLDSLSMVSIVSRCAAIFEVEIGTAETLKLYAARDVGDLVAVIGDVVSASSNSLGQPT